MKNKWIAIASMLIIAAVGLSLAVFAEEVGTKADTTKGAPCQNFVNKGRMGKGPGMGKGMGMGMCMGKMKAEMLEKVKINIVHEDNAVVIKMSSDDPETLNALKAQYAAGEDIKGPAAMCLIKAPEACACPCPKEKCQKEGKCVCAEACKKSCGASCATAKEGNAESAEEPADDSE
ncbi:MAG TPA: hypothetical protein PKW18_04605 [Candidatus Sumerlaeota bacterium]|nr:hypothetical protein [Candidatus Sumerlaeota bacterium]HRR30017.1 hypothetical protein [Candidatus Sumerlaeia bacterium]HON51215.1 hypothetical protein [Candidatus Sumerlaeota bacterium]HOR64468.1 hypothetical protein [Candidatus Sumerlaeota bacterium]HPL73836.1 hypothetical protein [Candidatus Sumerlaeota bacterium]